MNAITQASKPTRLDQFRMEILPPESKQDFFAGMPAHVKPERFMRNLDNAIMQNPGLMDLDPRLIFREIAKAAALGLYLDPQLGEAYLIEAWNGKAKRKEPQLRVGYRGLIKLGRQSGSFTIMYAHEVHENDHFDCDQGADKTLVHKPKLFADDRGPIVGYYAVVKYHDGEFDFEPLSVKQAHEIRDRSDGWRAFKAEKIKSTPWATDEVEMAKKTVIRKLCKRVPQSPELAEAFRIEDAAEHSEMRAVNITPPKPPTPPVPPVAKINAPTQAAPEPEDETIDAETGEIIEPEPRDEPTNKKSEPDKAAAHKSGSEGGATSTSPDESTAKSPSSSDTPPSDGGGISKETPEQEARRAGAEARHAGLSRKAVPAKFRKEPLLTQWQEGFDTGDAEDREPGDAPEFQNPDEILADAEERFACIKDEADWEELRSEFAHLEETLFPPDWDRLDAIMRKSFDRVTVGQHPVNAG